MDWTNLFQDVDQGRNLVKYVINICVPQEVGNFLTA